MRLKLPPLLKNLLVATLLFTIACVEPYSKSFTVGKTIFIVDGKLTNNASSNYVKLTESIPNSGLSISYLPVEGASVRVIENGNNEINLTEIKAGYYTYPSDFLGIIGNTYKLEFETKNGKHFESLEEVMTPSAPIDKIYHTFDKEAVKTATETLPGQKIYIDTSDPASTRDFYMWDWVLYESQGYCKSCEDALYYNDETTGPLGECRATRFSNNVTYDYNCDRNCWEKITSDKVNVMNDEFSNGKPIIGRLVAEIPIYQKIGALLEVRQYGIPKRVYEYLNLVASQGQNTGGLADTPPATLSGNISSPDDLEQAVAGYFIVSSVSRSLYWLDKSDVPDEVVATGLFNGRKVNPEQAGQDTTRPPLAPCVESDTRTPFQPEGWSTKAQF
ncbi:DUF4249 domain-containing protein [Arcticibacterium luteifluviistationis]|uniref:DUF4249 domain-containing protein n=1 Tax=Arcticibacterium luteifluviistationis TaxID=1784714 RepID=A0A2Z4GAH4_9BACT|nr:DUF4249 domain-containing protein [Arcticibacterium luteifluviistationis]AWV98144.1 hypothetical protein DJ013_08150 [Arcticibacterium luteifluviistationis]